MTYPNRVLPTGEIVAHPARGTLMGNRGVLHDADGSQLPRLWAHRAWVCCVLRFKGRRRKLRQPRRYTELFFLDEAVAFAAGHRPCAECRRADYNRWTTAWAEVHGKASAPEMDAVMHEARAVPGARAMRRGWIDDVADLPDGAFAMLDGVAHLIRQGRALPFAADGYGAARPLPQGPTEVLTPEPTLGVLRAGYGPRLHPTAG